MINPKKLKIMRTKSKQIYKKNNKNQKIMF